MNSNDKQLNEQTYKKSLNQHQKYENDDVIYVGKQEKKIFKKKMFSVISNKFLHLNLNITFLANQTTKLT